MRSTRSTVRRRTSSRWARDELDPVADRGVLNVGTDPSAVDHGCQKRDLLGAGVTKVEVGGPSGGAADSLGVDADELETPGYDPAVTGPVGPAVDHRVLKVDERTRSRPRVMIVHQHCTLLEQVAVALEREVDRRVEQRMARGRRRRPSGLPAAR